MAEQTIILVSAALAAAAEVGGDIAVVILYMIVTIVKKKINSNHHNGNKKHYADELELIFGTVKIVRPISRHKVQIQIENISKIIELDVSEPWVIDKGDYIAVSGEENKNNGKYMAYAYKNLSNGIIGHYRASWIMGTLFVIAGIAFFYAIFPIFHLIAGIKMLIMGLKSRRAYRIIKAF